MSDQTDPKFSDPNRVVGIPEDAERAPEGEGNRAEFAQYGADKAQFSIYDGEGNENVVVLTDNEEGKPVAATGETADEALKSVKKMDTGIGEDYYPPE
jgi:hypothetical protein